MTVSLPASTRLFRRAQPRAKCLLIVNKGPDAVAIPREGAAWDLMEIYFKEDAIERIARDPSLAGAEHVVFESDRRRRKFAITKSVFAADDFWRAYDAVLLADDDLLPVGCTVTAMFDLFLRTGCRVGQPALTPDSYFYHFITVRNGNFVWRKTNFAEVMCPVFTREGLETYLPVFDATATAFGLDYYWGYNEWRRGAGVALLDATPMRHGRPIDAARHRGGFEAPDQEFLDFMKTHEVPRYPHLCLGGEAEEADIAEVARLGLAISGYDAAVMELPSFATYVTNEIIYGQSRKAKK